MDYRAVFEFNRDRFVGAFHEESTNLVSCCLLSMGGVTVRLRREFRKLVLASRVVCLPDELHLAALRRLPTALGAGYLEGTVAGRKVVLTSVKPRLRRLEKDVRKRDKWDILELNTCDAQPSIYALCKKLSQPQT